MVLMPWSRLLVAACVLALAACGLTDVGARRPADGRLRVVASFYPLQFLAQRIGGDRVEVTSLTKAGAEPHDLELRPRDVASVVDAGLVVYLRGFQPAVDTAVDAEARGTAFDASRAADLDLSLDPAQSETGARTVDPHFWLDPVRLQAVARALAARMSAAAPASAAAFEANLATLLADLRALDADLRTGLASCASTDLVTGHAAFGYLARRYGLNQVPIAGLSPDAEPDTGRPAAVTAEVRSKGVRTVYTETLVSPAVADTLARETGARTAVLDPIEGLNDRSAGSDYLAVMRANLATLRAGQPCR